MAHYIGLAVETVSRLFLLL
ncbi:MAG: hypothetical protein HRT91_03855 [Piscirickettsiaceae bacterium]|nr:hypothetical protein [Piscirickettsiaceae bacterium]